MRTPYAQASLRRALCRHGRGHAWRPGPRPANPSFRRPRQQLGAVHGPSLESQGLGPGPGPGPPPAFAACFGGTSCAAMVVQRGVDGERGTADWEPAARERGSG